MSEAIIKAAADGDLETVRNLIENGDDVNFRDNGRWTPLILAAQNGHLEVVKLLIEKGKELILMSKMRILKRHYVWQNQITIEK